MKNHINIGTLILLAALSFVSFSCSNLFSTTGSITFALPATTTARSAENGVDCSTSDASTYEVTLTAPNNGETKTMTGNPGGSISIEELDPGTWTVSCRALNSKNVCIGCGKTDVSVEAGRTTEVNLALYLNATNTITSLYIHSNPAKTTYAAGDTLSLDGLTFSAQFANGNTAILSKDELALTTTPAEGEAIATDCTSVSVSYKSADTSYSLTIPLSVNADAPAITGEQKGSYFSAGTASDLVSCTASCIEGGALSFAWYVSDSEYGAGSSLSSDSYSTVENDSGSYTSTLKTKPEKAGTFYYYCIVTNKNEKVNGATSTTTTSSYYKIEFIAGSVTSFTAALTDSASYVLVGTTPALSLFTVTETYSSGTETTRALTDSDTGYTATTDYASNIGSIPVTITNTSLKTTQIVNVPYKYAMSAYAVTTQPSAISEAQYTGTSSFTAAFDAGKTYSVYTSGSQGDLSAGDTVSYQWYSNTTASTTGGTLISGATSTTYTPPVTSAGTTYYYCAATYKPSSDYCTTTASQTVTTNAVSAEVVAWTLSLTDTTAGSLTSAVTINNGGTQQLTAEHPYSICFTNTADDAKSTGSAIANSSAITWTSTDSSTTPTAGTSNWTFTAPAATSSEQSITLTATYKNLTFGVVTFTIPKATSSTTEYTVSSYTELANAVTAIEALDSKTGTINITASTLSDFTATITTTGTITINATATGGCTIIRTSTMASLPMFCANGGTLSLGTSGTTLTIDGNSNNNASSGNTLNSTVSDVKGTLVKGCNDSNLTIGSNCILTNNNTSSKGGGVHFANTNSSTTTLTIAGKISNCTSSGNGGGVYIEGDSTSILCNVIISGIISGNITTVNGAGIYIKNATATLSGATITGNKATATTSGSGLGGGIFFSSSTLVIENNTNIGTSDSPNTAGTFGGGIYHNGGGITLTSGAIQNNTTSGSGSQVYISSGTLAVGSTTYDNNTNGRAIDTALSN